MAAVARHGQQMGSADQVARPALTFQPTEPAEPSAAEVWEEAIRRAREAADLAFASYVPSSLPVAHSWAHYLAGRLGGLRGGARCLLQPPTGRFRPVIVQRPPWPSLFRDELAIQEQWVRHYYPQYVPQILPLIAYF